MRSGLGQPGMRSPTVGHAPHVRIVATPATVLANVPQDLLQSPAASTSTPAPTPRAARFHAGHLLAAAAAGASIATAAAALIHALS